MGRKKSTTTKQAPKTPSTEPTLKGAEAVRYIIANTTGVPAEELPKDLHTGWEDEYRTILKQHGHKLRTLKPSEKAEGQVIVLWRTQRHPDLLAAIVDETGVVDNPTGEKVPRKVLQRLQVTSPVQETTPEEPTSEDIEEEDVEDGTE